MNIVLCEYVNQNKHDAGNKARSDVLSILCSMGYRHIPLYRSGDKKRKIVWLILCSVVRAVLCANRNDNIIVQYPYRPNVVNCILTWMLRLGRVIKGYKMIIVIHDVICMREDNFESREGRLALKRELNILDAFDKIICHNEVMRQTFIDAGGNGNYVSMGPFDYIYAKEPVKVSDISCLYKVIIAGNLSKKKCGYLYQLPYLNNVQFNLYGINYSGVDNEYIRYKGDFSPEELIENLDGNFGLVWDGDICGACKGIYGTYLKYNNPHKFSLYLAAGLPVIVWENSALASYVRENEIGICVNELSDIEVKLKEINEKKYFEMIENVLRIREDIRVGKHLRKAID